MVRNGRAPDERRRYLCRDCGQRSRQDPRPNGYAEAERDLILRAYQERSSLRGLTRTFGVPRATRQVVACCLGDRSEENCRYFWEQVPEPWRQVVCHIDFWDASGAVLPAARHRTGGQGDGSTWNAGTMRSAREWARLCGRRCSSPDPTIYTTRVGGCSYIAITKTSKSSQIRPLPQKDDEPVVQVGTVLRHVGLPTTMTELQPRKARLLGRKLIVELGGKQ